MKVNTSLCFAVQITRSSIKPWSDDGHGLNHIINLRQRQYIRQQAERKLKKDNRVALLGRGIALVKRVDENEVAVTLRKKMVLQIARKDIMLNQHNRPGSAQPQLS